MNSSSSISTSLRKRFGPLEVIEWLIVFAIVGIVIFLLWPTVQYASSGSIELPVRVVVFDAEQAQPIAGTHVAIVRAPAPTTPFNIAEYREAFDFFEQLEQNSEYMTGNDGGVVINHSFGTSGSHANPTRVHLQWAWVIISAHGYARAVVPVRDEPQPLESVRDGKELLVTIGLGPAPQSIE